MNYLKGNHIQDLICLFLIGLTITDSMADKFTLAKKESGYVILPNELYQFLLISSLPLDAIRLVFLVYRFTFPYKHSSLIIDSKDLHRFLGIHRLMTKPLVLGLVRLNILTGGIAKCRKDGRALTYELSVNPTLSEWDVGMPSNRKTFLDKLHEEVLTQKGYKYDQSKKEKSVSTESNPNQTELGLDQN